MTVDRTRVLRGALAGAIAAGVWAAQQPLDKRVFGVDYDDAELLGAAITRRRGTVATFAIGHALHALNGAVFGAAYAAVSPAIGGLGGPGYARGALAGLTEHAATWPLTRFLGAVHPAGDQFPKLWGDRARARAGDLAPPALRDPARDDRGASEPAPGEAAPADEDRSTTNGHGNVEHLIVTRA